MTTSKKPATAASTARKKPVKRGPTKAAALKALGITAEDLQALKDLRADETNGHNDVQEYAPAPDVEVAPVEAKEPIFYIRNLRGVDVGFRLESQEGAGKRRTELKPRGQRGDMKRITKDDLRDANLATQISYDLVEIITEHEALEIASKQDTNIGRAPSVLSQLRNELGQPYAEGAVKVEESFEKQGVVVAHLNPQGGGAGELPGLQRGGINWEQARNGITQQASPGGNPAIISDGFADPAQQADAVARIKGLEGPAAGLGGVTVTLAPTERAE